jgi:hypothetical protein
MLHRNMGGAGAYSIPNVRDLLKGSIYFWRRPATGATQAGASKISDPRAMDADQGRMSGGTGGACCIKVMVTRRLVAIYDRARHPGG